MGAGGCAGLCGLSDGLGDGPRESDKPERRGRLLGLQAVELIDEPLELGYGMVALVEGESLIDSKGHGPDCDAHLADGVSIALGSGVVLIDEHGA